MTVKEQNHMTSVSPISTYPVKSNVNHSYCFTTTMFKAAVRSAKPRSVLFTRHLFVTAYPFIYFDRSASRSFTSSKSFRTDLRPSSLDTFTDEENMLRDAGMSFLFNLHLSSRTYCLCSSQAFCNGSCWAQGPRDG